MSEKLYIYIYCLAVTGCCFPSLQDGKFVAELKEAADVSAGKSYSDHLR